MYWIIMEYMPESNEYVYLVKGEAGIVSLFDTEQEAKDCLHLLRNS